VPLNHWPYSRRTEELKELVRTLQKIEIDEVRIERECQLSRKPVNKTPGSLSPAHLLYGRANKILSACQWSPRIHRPPDRSFGFIWEAGTERDDWENSFVWWLLGLRARREISLIRICPTCENWFFACTNHQIYCSDRCRQQSHAMSLSFKEKRRLYMRHFRANEKARDAKTAEVLKSDKERRFKAHS
jgi:hypothetical protein